MKCNMVQIMGMATSYVFMALIILSLAFFSCRAFTQSMKSVIRSASAHSNKFEN